MLKGMVNNPASFLKDMKNFSGAPSQSLSNLPRNRSAAYKTSKSVASKKRMLSYIGSTGQ